MKRLLKLIFITTVSVHSFAFSDQDINSCMYNRVDIELEKILGLPLISDKIVIFESTKLDRTSASGKKIYDRDYGFNFRNWDREDNLAGKAWMRVSNISADGLSLDKLRCEFTFNFRNPDGSKPCESYRAGLELTNEDTGVKVIRSINHWPPSQCGIDF